jgi:hypothetical protein
MFKFISNGTKSKGFSGTKRYLGDLGKTVILRTKKHSFFVLILLLSLMNYDPLFSSCADVFVKFSNFSCG